MDDHDLTGRWDGIFSYPWLMPRTHFTADIRDNGGSFAGEIHELGQTRKTIGKSLHAFIQGDRLGNSVRFTKLYDNLHDHRILYEGTLADEGHEISGQWSIPSMWAGTFIMVRPRSAEQATEQRATVEV